MRLPLLGWCTALLLAAATLVGSSHAKPGAEGPDGVRRDPAGQKGISPYNEQLAKGRKAVQEGDLDGAVAAFQQATQLDDKPLLGYLLLGQVLLAKGDRAAAVQASQDGRQRAGTEQQQSKMLMFDADLSERTAEDANEGPDQDPEVTWKPPREAWTGYAAFVGGHPKAPDYRQSATEREKQIQARVKREKDYAIVRKRIADNAKKRGDSTK